MSPFAFDLPLERHRLDNGLRVILHRDTALPLVAINLWYHVGSRNERPGRTGFAHLFEHMLFQGSQNIGTNDHFHYVQQAGGVANGSTWYDRTNYYETLPAHRLDLGLWLESDRMGFLLPAMTLEKLENQRRVVMNERRQRIDNQPYGRAFERLHELLYPAGHPYRWPVIGYMDDIAAATAEDVEEFFRTWYTPDNAVLTLAGDFDSAAALDRVAHWFGELPRGGERPAPAAPVSDPTTPVREELPDAVELTRLYIGFRLPPYGHPDWYAADLLATLLSSGKSSPLVRDLVHGRQLAQDAAAFLLPTEMEATFVVVSTARPEVAPATLLEAVWEHLEAIAAGAPKARDLERARNRSLTAAWEGYQALDQRADHLALLETFRGDPTLYREEIRLTQEMPGETLSDVARRLLRRDLAATLMVVPEAR